MDKIYTFFKTKEIRNRIGLTILLLILFRILSHIPVPWVNTEVLAAIGDSSIIALAGMYSGGALQNFTMMAIGVSSYISVSIIMQMLSFFVPVMHEMSRNAAGQKQIKKLTGYLGFVLALILSVFTTHSMQNTYGLLTSEKWYIYATIAIIHAIGTAIAIWIGETIASKGFGNGMSLLIGINIITSLPSTIKAVKINHEMGLLTTSAVITVVSITLLLLILIVFVETTERRIPLYYSKAAARGDNMFLAPGKMYFPIKLNLSSVMPIILASYIMQIVSMFMGLNWAPSLWLRSILEVNSIQFHLIFTVFIFGFSYLYAALMLDCREASENLRKNGAIIPSVRPGFETGEYLKNIRNKTTLVSALYLSLIYLIPSIVFTILEVNIISATSIIILVSVSLETCETLRIELDLRREKDII